MVRNEYRASLTNRLFWFLEFKKTVELLNSGMTLAEIKELNIKENIYSATSRDRASRIFNTVARRIKALDASFYSLFERCNIANQKLIALISVMLSDNLFFDFMYEVYRDKLILGAQELANRDFNIFFENKRTQSNRVAGWTEQTFKDLTKRYKAILEEAGIAQRTKGKIIIMRPILEQTLEGKLKERSMEAIFRALTGVS